MIEKHEDGKDLIRSLKREYDLEIELLCLNNEFIGSEELKRKLNQYKTLRQDFPYIAVLKESEFNSQENEYYEMSLFCNKEDSEKFSIILNDRGISVDLIHNNKS